MEVLMQPVRGCGTGRWPNIACVAAVGATLLLGVSAALGAADPPPPVWQGVWQGSIGALPVRACLTRDGVGNAFGSYYYLSRLRTIRLEQQGTSKVWTEGWGRTNGPPAPRWTFAEVGRDRLAGSWGDGKRSLTFRLARVPGGEVETPCGTDAFNGPRWRPLTVTASPATKDGVGYNKLVFRTGPAFPDVSMEGFALLGTDAATRRINAGLRARVPGAQDDWRGCITGGLDAHGVDGDFQTSLTPTLVTPRWLGATLDESDDCGGAHPNSSSTPITFDRTTGAVAKLQDWLSDAALDRSAATGDLPPTVRPAFRQLIIAAAGDVEAECRETLVDQEYWDIGLDRRGLTFRPELPHVTQACAEDMLVPWTTLARFLTPAGRAGRATLSAR